MKNHKYISLFFALYNFFLVVVVIFDFFSLPRAVLRFLLILSAAQVGLYKLLDAAEAMPTPHSESQMERRVNIVQTTHPIVKIRHAIRNHKEIHNQFRKDIYKELAHDIGREMLEQDLIQFQELEPQNDYITTVAEVDVVKY